MQERDRFWFKDWIEASYVDLVPADLVRSGTLPHVGSFATYTWLVGPGFVAQVYFTPSEVRCATYLHVSAGVDQWLRRSEGLTKERFQSLARAKQQAVGRPLTFLPGVALDLFLYFDNCTKPVIYTYVAYDQLPRGILDVLERL